MKYALVALLAVFTFSSVIPAATYEPQTMHAVITKIEKHHITLMYRVRPTNTIYETVRMRINKKSRIAFTPHLNQSVIVTCMERGRGHGLILSMVPE